MAPASCRPLSRGGVIFPLPATIFGRMGETSIVVPLSRGGTPLLAGWPGLGKGEGGGLPRAQAPVLRDTRRRRGLARWEAPTRVIPQPRPPLAPSGAARLAAPTSERLAQQVRQAPQLAQQRRIL